VKKAELVAVHGTTGHSPLNRSAETAML